MMRRHFLLMAAAIFFMASCSSVPGTGRKQLNFLPASQINAMSLQEYNQFLSENKVVRSGAQAQQVKKVGLDIANAVQKYLTANKQSKRISEFKWEFNLVDDPTVNAWCMPGGKVVFYTGILPYTKTETGMAVVMGHEVAHAVARHGNERMSQGLLQQFGAVGLAVALKDKPAQTQQLFMNAYAVGSTVGVMLPFSRKQESEADQLGLLFMAMAGYNPQEAVAFWQRMSGSGGAAPPQFLSTHPSHQTRIKDLQKYMPAAMRYYKSK